MKRIPLATTGRTTTQLGFGCAFPPSVTAAQAARLFDAAFDAGIRHFDVAPMYSDGLGEGYLGNFLAKNAGTTTVTTKYGILPTAKRPAHVQLARTVLGPVLRTMRQVPLLKRGLSKTASAMKVSAKAAFNAAQARESLNHSLKQLRLDKIDVFLMHEPEVADLADLGLLQFLTESVGASRIGIFGIGGESKRVLALYNQRRPFCKVMQFDWSVLAPDYDLGDSFRIHYSAFLQPAKKVHAILLERPDMRKQWSESIDLDVGDIRELTAVMLKAALVRHPNSLVLFRSSSPANIVRNVQIAENSALENTARRFLELTQKSPLRGLDCEPGHGL